MNESQTEFPAIVRGCPAGFRPVPAPRAPKPEPYLFREIGLRVVQEVERAEPLPVINSPADLHALVERMRAFLFPNPDVEQFVAVAVNTKNRVIGWHTVSVGTLNSTNALPREVFRFAVLAAAKAIAVVHNHPTGVMPHSVLCRAALDSQSRPGFRHAA